VQFQAVKYLERMLIQAQTQKEREKSSKPTTKLSNINGCLEDSTINLEKEIKIEQEEDLINKDDRKKNDENAINDGKEQITDIEMKDVSSTDDKKQENISVNNEKEINIDPRTYCKLGHFHLLLEDYPKGKHIIKSQVYLIKIIFSFLYSIIGIPKISKFKIRLLERYAFSLWTWNCLLSL